MKLHFLGTGSALPTKERQNLSLLLEAENEIVLVDTSGTPMQGILKTGASLDHLKDVILTHAHVDHLYALPSLLHCLWLRRRKAHSQTTHTIRLHGLKETLAVAGKLIEAFDLREKPETLPIEMITVDPDVEEKLDIKLGNLTINAFRVEHGGMPTIGFYIEKPDGTRLLFSSDAIVTDAIRSRLTSKTKILIHDCGGGMKSNGSHAGAEEIAELIQGTAVEEVYLVHLPDYSEVEVEATTASVSKASGKEIIVPIDRQLITEF